MFLIIFKNSTPDGWTLLTYFVIAPFEGSLFIKKPILANIKLKEILKFTFFKWSRD